MSAAMSRKPAEIRRRTYVIRIFPDAASCLWLVRAQTVEMHGSWIEVIRNLNPDSLRELKKKQLRQIEAAA